MPGRRNHARERAQHAIDAPRKQAALYDLLKSQLPERDHALIGWPSILRYLHDFGLRRLNGRPLTERIVRRWIATDSFPVVRGNRHPTYRTMPVSSEFAALSWALTRFHVGDLFTVAVACGFAPSRSFATPLERERAVT